MSGRLVECSNRAAAVADLPCRASLFSLRLRPDGMQVSGLAS
jgi:hypothetical protein